MYSIVATPNIINWMNLNLAQFLVQPSTKHIARQYHCITTSGENFLIKVYSNNNLTIEGSLAKRAYASLLNNSINEIEVGCDEVGVGDFFGPVVYVAAKIDEQTMSQLAQLFVNIQDSKRFSDADVLIMFAKIKDVVEYKAQIIYDKDIKEPMNAVEQKVYYHFQNIDATDEKVIIDLFTTLNAFYKYQKNFGFTLPKNLILETKADSKFISVALASIIARALFLIEMGRLNEKYNFEFPKGSSNKNLDNIIDDFIKKNSLEELQKIAKTSFSTYKRAEERWK